MSNVELWAKAADWHASRWAVSYAVNALWQVPMIAAAAWAVARMVRRAGPRTEHALWVGALMLMIVLPATPRQHWQLHPGNATVSMGVSDVDWADLPPLTPVAPPLWDGALGMATLPRGLVLALLLGYLGAGLYFATRLGWSLWRTRMLVREADEISFEQDAETAWERCREAFGLGEVRRLVSGEIACPVTVGRGTVLVPLGFVESAGAEELLTAMAHECAHVQRRDFWKNVAYELASLPVAFHPVLWMVKRQIAETREMVCDRAAVERVVAPGSYVRSLLRLAESVVGPPRVMAAMGMFDGRTLERRIVSMRTRKERLSRAARWGVVAASVLAGVAVIAGGMTLAVQVEAKAAPVTAPVAAPLSLTLPQTDAASAAVAVQPEAGAKAQSEKSAETPGADAKEHARRVAYARQHFGYGDVDGENSDRGRLYIRYGKPTEIESHPSGGVDRVGDGREVTVKYPFEVWTYGHLEGVGDHLQMEFVDECQCGEYHATPMGSGAMAFGMQGPLVASAEPMRIFFPSHMSAEEVARQQALQAAQMAALQQRFQELHGKQAFTAEEMAKLNQQLKKQMAQRPALTAEEMAKLQAQSKALMEELQKKQAWVITDRQMALQQQQALSAEQYKAFQDSFHALRSAPGASIYTHELFVPRAAQNPDYPVRVSGRVAAGSKISGDEPVYPPIAKAAHVQGAVVLHAIISKEGAVTDLNVVSGPGMLQHASLDAVRTWRYKPFVLNGQPTAVETTITVNFAMQPDGRGGMPVRVSGGTEAGSKIGGDDPKYPPIARAAHVQGAVVLHAIISKEGSVSELSVISGPQMLQNAAEEAVRTWRYKPFVVNGEPTAVETTITVNFTMNDDAGKPEAPVVLPQGAEARPIHYAVPAGAQVEPGVYRIGGGVSAPRVLRSVEPEFTEEARKAAKAKKFDGGTVLVNLVVDRQGRPQQVRVLKPLGFGLDEKAVESVRQYEFAPAMRNGQPVAVALSMEVDFQLF